MDDEASTQQHEGAPAPSPSAPHQPVRGRRVAVVVGAGVAALTLVAGSAWALAARATTDPAPGLGATRPDGTASFVTPTGPGGIDATGTAAAAMLPSSQPTLVLGDSLGLVVYPWFADLVPDRAVTYEAEVGRSTARTARALEKLSTVPPVVIVSSGTNDQFTADLTAGATRVLDTLGSARCVVWVDVVRPDRVGDSQQAMNTALDAVVASRPNVRILRWSAMVSAHPEWLAGDGIHTNELGSRARAQAFADAAAACSPIDPNAPRARRQVLPASIFWGPISGTARQAGGSTHGSSNAASPGPSGATSGGPTSSTSTSPSSSSTPSSSPSTPDPSGPAPSTPAPTPTPPASTAPPPTSEPPTTTPAPADTTSPTA